MNRRKKTLNKMEAAAIEIRTKIELTQAHLDAERRLLGAGPQPVGLWRRQKYHYTAHWFTENGQSIAMNRAYVSHTHSSHCRRIFLYNAGYDITESTLFCLFCASEYLGRFIPL